LLVERHADAKNAVLIRTLAFLLARAAAPELDNRPVAPLVWTVIARLRSDDPWCRVNLLTAMERLDMNDALLGPGARPPPQLYPFLLDCLGGGEDLQAAVCPVIARLNGLGVLAELPPEQIATLRQRLLSLRDTASSKSLLKMELDDLGRFFLDTGRKRFPIRDDLSAQQLLSELDAMEEQPADKDHFDYAWALMEALARLAGGLSTMVKRYAGARTSVLIRNLTLVLARAVYDPKLEVAPLIWTAVRELRSADPLSRVNVLEAIGAVLRHESRVPRRARLPPQLYPFLLDCLGHDDTRVLAETVSVIGGLYAYDILPELAPEQVAVLRARLLSLRDTASDERLKMQLKFLNRFFEEE
jgi:hypothetical protein